MIGRAALLVSASMLAACASANNAPVVWGDGAGSTARIYNSPRESAVVRTAAAPSAVSEPGYRPRYQNGYQPASVSTGAPAPLVPVSEVRAEGRQRFDYDAQPVYLAEAQPSAAPLQAAADPGEVVVRPGDTVYAISRRTGATPQAIIAVNRLKAPYTLSVGQSLRVPGYRVADDVRATQVSIPSTRSAEETTAARGERVHIVRPGDTLYAIARSTGVAVEELARVNRLRAPYALSVGDQIRVPGGGAVRAVDDAPDLQREASVSGDVADLARSVSYTRPETKSSTSMFDWPVKGAILSKFGPSGSGRRNDGVNIAAPTGTPVRAAADGEVVYRGAELDGYGNLLLIKHDDGFVTAYAHNDVMLVRKGQTVRKGQVIAKVGQTGSATEPQLHFEIRQNLKSVDPLALLGQ